MRGFYHSHLRDLSLGCIRLSHWKMVEHTLSIWFTILWMWEPILELGMLCNLCSLSRSLDINQNRVRPTGFIILLSLPTVEVVHYIWSGGVFLWFGLTTLSHGTFCVAVLGSADWAWAPGSRFSQGFLSKLFLAYFPGSQCICRLRLFQSFFLHFHGPISLPSFSCIHFTFLLSHFIWVSVEWITLNNI